MNATIIFPSDQGVPVTPAAIAVIGCHNETANVHLVIQSSITVKGCHKEERASVHLVIQSSITVTRKQPA